ncbi:hypothetical protein SAMN05421640_1347 [Ekhidna lutea]|uniref:SnoaL-like domain-containing protein n=1 Tax=Ekhidna lutea TaxID=447679 RepID=A0A239HJ99_EKHLU|nr:hypothetical protein [Ekhidna lutea]SNS81427.1 hypothetical protein SAMN05421640_1347 [Ekhidna lutea]
MKILASYFILFLPFFITAQTEDPNAKAKAMGLTETDIADLCNAAVGDLPNYYDWEVPPVFEIIYDVEGKPYPDFPTKKEAHDWLDKIWEEKYSCVYCEITDSITGTLDMMGLYHETGNWEKWVYILYDPEGPFKAKGINKIRVINDYLEVKGTLLDYLYYVTEERPTREVEKNPSFEDSLNGMKARIIKYGGKRMKDMTPEEIEENSQ